MKIVQISRVKKWGFGLADQSSRPVYLQNEFQDTQLQRNLVLNEKKKKFHKPPKASGPTQ